MKSKRNWLSTLPMLMIILVLAACGGNSNEGNANNNEGEGNDEDEEVTVTYARGVDTTGATEVLTEASEEEHPNINIEYKEMRSDSGDPHDQYGADDSA